MCPSDLILEKAETLLSETNLFKAESEASVYTQVCEFIMDNLGASVVLVFPLSLAAFPIFNPLLYGCTAYSDTDLGEFSRDLRPLIEKWQSANFTLDKDTDTITKPSLRSYLCFQNITVYQVLPIGTQDDPVSVLIIGYKNKRIYTSNHSLIMRLIELFTYSRVSAIRYKTFFLESIGRSELNTHRLFGKYGLKLGAHQPYSRFLSRIRSENPNVDLSGLTDLINRFDQLLNELRLWESSTSYSSTFARNTTLEQNIQFYVDSLQQSIENHFNIVLDIDTAVEYEKPPIVLTLFRIAIVSINNAVYHGKATNIQVVVKRETSVIYARVTNDGIPLPAEVRPSPDGVFFLQNEIQKLFGAKFTVGNQESGIGTIVECSIPSIQVTV